MKNLAVIAAIILLCFTLFACSSSFNSYRNNMADGMRTLGAGEYQKAQESFLRANEAQGDARSYALAATASYKLNNLPVALRLIEDSERLDGRSHAHLRILGYKALILLSQGKQEQGRRALDEYVLVYQHAFPLNTVDQVKEMSHAKSINVPLLELLLDEQINNYEKDVAQLLLTDTGFYEERYAPNPGGGF